MSSPIDHLAAQVRDAYAARAPLHVQGGASKRFHVPQQPGVQLLDVTPVQGILSYMPSELVVTVRAGTPLQALQQALAERGQCLPFDPPQFSAQPGRNPTVGGMVAAGWSGPARASVGGVRDYVLGVQMINGQGQLLRFGGQVMKNVAGYDISRLMVGSWGCLGVLTEVSLKVLPVPVGDATLCLPCTQADALQHWHRWRAQPLPIHASAWVPASGAAIGHEPAPGQMYIRLRGAAAAVQAALGHMGGEVMDAVLAAAWWADCRDHQLPWFAAAHGSAHALWRLSLPPTALPVPAWEGVGAPLLEWGGAQRWLHAPLALGEELQRWAQAAGGRAVLFKAPSSHLITRLAQWDCAGDGVLQALQQRVKDAFDPAGIFNPAWAMAPAPHAPGVLPA